MKLIPQESVRSVVVFMIVILPGFMFSQGRADAKLVLDGQGARRITADQLRNAKGLAAATLDATYKYVGQIGDYAFLGRQQVFGDRPIRQDRGHRAQSTMK